MLGPRRVDQPRRFARHAGGKIPHGACEPGALLGICGIVVEDIAAERAARLRAALAHGIRQMAPGQPVAGCVQRHREVGERERHTGAQKGPHRSERVASVGQALGKAEAAAGAQQAKRGVRITAASGCHIRGRHRAGGETVGEAELCE